MSDNVLETVQKLVQDVVAPDVRAIKVKVEELEKRMDERFKAVDDRFDNLQATLLAAIGELKATNEVATLREVGSIRERLAVVETQLAQIRSAA